jgi:parvulin-like peptidyl-prolyl isomerase
LSEKSKGISSLNKAWIAIGVAAVLAGGLILWQTKFKQDDFITKITKEDMAILIEDWPDEQKQALAKDLKKRQDVLKQLKELLAEAVEAKNTGMVNSPEGKDQMALLRSLAVAQEYDKSQKAAGPGPAFSFLKQEEIDAYLKAPDTAAKFDHFLVVAKAAKLLPDGDIPEEDKDKIKQEWSKIMLAEKKATQAGFDKLRKTRLQITLQQAQWLAGKYSKEKLADQLKVTDQEVADYIAKHPEYDTAPKRAKAEDLLRRARGGEDFAKLATDNTDDPGSKANGGFYDWFPRGRMVKEFEDAAFSMKVGDISNLVETQYGYHIIKLEGKRTQKNADTGKDEEQVQVRHILISTAPAPDPNNPEAAGGSAKDQVKNILSKEKRDKVIAEIVKRTGVSVPDDFEVKVGPPAPEMGPGGPGQPGQPMPGGPPGGPQPGGPQPGGEPVEPVPGRRPRTPQAPPPGTNPATSRPTQ